jgi:L-fucose mutarotase
MMQCVPGDVPDPSVEAGYRAVIDQYAPQTPLISFIERFDFYKRASKAFVVVMTGDTRKYANIILKKGVC